MMLSISTSWNDKQGLPWRDWFNQVKNFGLSALELGYMVNHAGLKEIEGLLPEFNFKVSSIHNFCPIPNDEPSCRHVSNYYRLSSLDSYERAKAIEWTKVCIDTACRVKAPVVVIHAGTLDKEGDPANAFVQLYREGKQASREFQKLRQDFIQFRRTQAAPFIEALENSLKQVMDYAQKNKIKIGLETRYYPNEIPNFEEIGYFLNLFHRQGMYYWHDVGHAEINERLGLVNHLDFLKAYQDKMIGVHLHGMKVARDHLAPFDGDMDLNKILPFIKSHMYRVIEARHATPAQIKEAVQKLI